MNIFVKRLRGIMEERQLSQADIVAMTGISKAAISQYLSGKNVPRSDSIKTIAEALGVSVEYFDVLEEEKQDYGEVRNLPVDVAAKLMGVSPQFIRVGLQRGTLPFGWAVQQSKNRYTYWIGPVKFSEWTGIKVGE